MEVVAAEPALTEPVVLANLPNPAALSAIMAALVEKYPTEAISDNTDIFGTGLTDSQTFLDIIFSVETQTALQFDADLLDFEGAMTPLRMAQAFRMP